MLFRSLDETRWPQQAFTLKDGPSDTLLPPVFRSDDGNVLVGPVLVKMAPCETRTLRLKPSDKTASSLDTPLKHLAPKQDGHRWEVAQDLFAGVAFEPLVGEWKQVPSYFTNPHPNENVEAAHENIAKAPFAVTNQAVSDGMDTARWRTDLLRIREVEEPGLSVEGLVFAGAKPVPFVHFRQRLSSIIRFETGPRPNGTWRFRLHAGRTTPVVFADAPFSEERRDAESFYCARYVRLEWPDRHLLWCPSQNTLFRRVREGDETAFECTVFDFTFTGAANWDMRFYAAPSFSPADSMRLAETCHRKPFRVPVGVSAGRVAGIAVDNPSVMVTHLFPADGGATGVRMLNASDKPQTATVAWPGDFGGVTAADTEGSMSSGGWTHDRKSTGAWKYAFRPWEMATFRVT